MCAPQQPYRGFRSTRAREHRITSRHITSHHTTFRTSGCVSPTPRLTEEPGSKRKGGRGVCWASGVGGGEENRPLSNRRTRRLQPAIRIFGRTGSTNRELPSHLLLLLLRRRRVPPHRRQWQ